MLNRRARRALQSRRKRVKKPFAHVINRVTVILGLISYRHPTKGLRTRRLTPPLAIGLLTAQA